MSRYFPKQGDLVVVEFDPQSGHEQKGRRPALVISKTLFNETTGLAIVCPITNKDRRSPFHVVLGANEKVTGFVMVEQAKSVDLNSRNMKLIGNAHADLLEEVLAILDTILY